MIVPPPPPRFREKLEEATIRAINRMTSDDIRRDMDAAVRRYILPYIGRQAVLNAQRMLGSSGQSGAHIEQAHRISMSVRQIKGRRANPHALLDTGELKKSIRWWMDGSTLRVGVKGGVKGNSKGARGHEGRQDVAFFLEHGYTIRISGAMIGQFKANADAAGEAHRRARADGQDVAGIAQTARAADGWRGLKLAAEHAGIGATWSVAPRPFMRPAMEQAVANFKATSAGRAAEGLLRVAMHGMSGMGGGLAMSSAGAYVEAV